MSCPNCGYVMTEFEKDCARCKKLGTRGPTIATAGGTAATGATPQMPQPEYRPQVPQGDWRPSEVSKEVHALYRPNWVNIGLMWGLSFLSVVAVVNGGLLLGIIMDLIAIVLAFMLNGSDSPVDKVNGRVKLGLEVVVWFIGVASSLHRNG